MLQSIVLNGADVADRILEFSGNQDVRGVRVIVTDRVTEVNGTVDGCRQARTRLHGRRLSGGHREMDVPVAAPPIGTSRSAGSLPHPRAPAR